MGLVFVENFHGGILLHVMVPVKVILKLVVRVESRLYVFDRACETENLVLHNPSRRLLSDDLGTRMIKTDVSASCRQCKLQTGAEVAISEPPPPFSQS